MAGTFYWIVFPSSGTEPANSSAGADFIIAGQDGAGVTAAASDSVADTGQASPVDAAAAATGLTAGTAYKVAWAWKDGSTYATGGYVVVGSFTTAYAAIPADAAAAGADAQIIRTLQVNASPGAAVADVAAAGVALGLTIGAAPAQAAADGASAAVSLALIIATAPGEAAADGTAAQIILGGNVNATPAEATAGGATASIIRTLLIGATPGAAVADGADADVRTGGAASAAEVWEYELSNGQTAGAVLVQILTYLEELHLIHGLRAGSPLTVAAASRDAGAVSQSIAEAAGVVTVTRQ